MKKRKYMSRDFGKKSVEHRQYLGVGYTEIILKKTFV